MGLTVHGVSCATKLPVVRLHEIVHKRWGVSAGTAIALAAFFEQTPEFWLNAQKAHELSLVRSGLNAAPQGIKH